MVHLTTIKNDAEHDTPVGKLLQLSLCDEKTQTDDFTSSVYGSRFALEALPSHEMPEKEMPKDVAYRLIR
jgi:glutamate decarboxylase